MQNITKRAFSLLLALVLCLGLLSGIRLDASAATVDYVYGAPTEISKYTDVIYNWGTRGTTATFLSPNAISFYSDNNITYSELALLSGSSSTSSVPSSALYSALHSLVADNQTQTTSYGDTRYLFRFTDCQESGGAISCFYSGAAIGPDWGSSPSWNREHTWPDSKGDGNGDGENDIMMLRPTSSSLNSSRGNKAYGEVTSTSYYNPNEASGGKYDLRGDVARVVLYVYTRWGTENMWGSSGVIESKEVLLKWMEEDPVDTWEMGRNDSVESITGTRNVYVDYPELAFVLFNEEVPADMTTPSGGENVVTPSYTVTATTNNTAYGSVTLSGTTITATPATGCYVDGHTVVSGQATVNRIGNTFHVTPASDCTVQINFAANSVSTDDSVQFVSNNIMYADRMKLMYAVYNPNNENYTIELTAGGEPFDIIKVQDNVEIHGKQCTTYVSEYGVPLQNMETVVTAKLFVDGVEKDSLDYSVLEYLHEMPTKLGGGLSNTSITEAKKAAMLTMYSTLLRTAANIQRVLSGSATIDSYGYVYVTNGTINGEQGTLLPANTQITASDLAAAGTVTAWKYQIVGGESGELTDGLDIGTNNIILTAEIDQTVEPSEPDTPTTGTIRFDFGANGSATHADGSDLGTGKTYTENGYTLTLTNCTKVYGSAYDATGNSCLKLGTSNTAGAFQFTVPDDVAQVVIYVAQYKENTTKVKVNDTDYTISTASNNGEYTAITVDTSTVKTVSVTTASGGLRAMVDAILFKTTGTEAPSEPETEPTEPSTEATEPSTEATEPSKKTAYVEKSLSEITDSDKVIITMTASNGTVYVLTSNNGTSKAPTAVIATVANGEIALDTVQDAWLWNIAQESGGVIIYTDGSTTEWLYCTDTNNGVRVGTNTNKYFSIDAASGYLKHNATGRYVGVYTTNPDWRCYTNTTGNTANQTLRFFVLVEE